MSKIEQAMEAARRKAAVKRAAETAAVEASSSVVSVGLVVNTTETIPVHEPAASPGQPPLSANVINQNKEADSSQPLQEEEIKRDETKLVDLSSPRLIAVNDYNVAIAEENLKLK